MDFLKLLKVLRICAKFRVFATLPLKIKLGSNFILPRANTRPKYKGVNRVKIEDFNIDNILLDEKSNENILVYDMSYKTLIGAKS